MKKFSLSAFVVLAFGLYVFFTRSSDYILNSYSAQGGNNQLRPDQNQTATRNAPIQSATTQIPAPIYPSAGNSTINAPAQNQTKKGLYADGKYIGNSADAYYGNVQVKAVISGGQITDVIFLDYPQDMMHSVLINSYAMPILKSEAIKSQNAQVDTVSGATETSGAFRESLASALAQAKN